MKPFLFLRRIQFVPLNSGTIGHFVMDTEKVMYNIDELSNQSEKIIPIFILESKISNLFFVEILKRLGYLVVSTFPFMLLHGFLRKMLPYYRWRTLQVMNKSELIVAKLHDSPKRYEFTEGDNVIGEEFLKEIGFSQNDKIVCCVFRDLGYDIAMQENDYEDKQGYRITPIKYFEATVRFLIDSGFKVVRMGRHNVHRLALNSSSYVDISDHPNRNHALLDFFLFSKCSFVLTTGSGIDAPSTFFRKPQCFLNVTYAHYIPSTKLWPMVLLSDYLYIDSNQKIPLEVVLSDKLTNIWHGDLSSIGVEIKPKDSDKILAAVKIFLGKITGSRENQAPSHSNLFNNVGAIYY